MTRHQRLFVRKITKKVLAILPFILLFIVFALAGTSDYNACIIGGVC